jgi:hypothetical protein
MTKAEYKQAINRRIMNELSHVEADLYYHSEKANNAKIQAVADMIKEACRMWHEITGATIEP